MSAKLFALTLTTTLPPSQKLVMMALANQANDYGEDCFPGFELIQQHASLSRRAVFDALRILEDEGFISRFEIGVQKVGFRIHVDRLRQVELAMPEQRSRNVPRATSAQSAPVRNLHKCITRTSAASAPVQKTPETGAPAALLKAPKSTQGEEEGARAGELATLPDFDRRAVKPYVEFFPPTVPLSRAAEFVKHRNAIRQPMSISAARQLLLHLQNLAGRGVDLDESLRLTMLAGLAIPVVPGGKGGARAGPKPRASDDFSTATYQGTADHDLPAHLRSS